MLNKEIPGIGSLASALAVLLSVSLLLCIIFIPPFYSGISSSANRILINRTREFFISLSKKIINRKK